MPDDGQFAQPAALNYPDPRDSQDPRNPRDARYRLISHPLCPYVQRAVITLLEKSVRFVRIDIDLANKPEWFKTLSPLGKTPLLQVGDEVLFESAVICDYLDEVESPRLHPYDALARARHRAWMEFASATLNSIGAFYSVPDDTALDQQVIALRNKFSTLESPLTRSAGPYFAGESFSLVDAAFAPVFRYFDVFDEIADFDIFTRTPRTRAWRAALAARASVARAVSPDYPQRLRRFLEKRNAALTRRMHVAR